MIKVAIIGTVGVPAKYGGFETLVDNILENRCLRDIKYTVYCSAKAYNVKLLNYKEADLKYIPLKANGIQSVLYDILSLLKAVRKHDALLILGVSGCLILPLVKMFTGTRIIVNIDGLEHKRDKWNFLVRKFLKFSEKIAVRNADIIISDNKSIQEYVKKEYDKKSILIAYGGDHVVLPSKIIDLGYSLGICRIEPENNVHIILEAFSLLKEKLIFVGNWNNSQYGIKLRNKYGNKNNIQLLDPIYDLHQLGQLRSECHYYIHGHSAGGTNPSLVEAMFYRKPILAFDVCYNRETTENQAEYFTTVHQLKSIVESNVWMTHNATAMHEIAQRRYRWKVIVRQYEELY